MASKPTEPSDGEKAAHQLGRSISTADGQTSVVRPGIRRIRLKTLPDSTASANNESLDVESLPAEERLTALASGGRLQATEDLASDLQPAARNKSVAGSADGAPPESDDGSGFLADSGPGSSVLHDATSVEALKARLQAARKELATLQGKGAAGEPGSGQSEARTWGAGKGLAATWDERPFDFELGEDLGADAMQDDDAEGGADGAAGAGRGRTLRSRQRSDGSSAAAAAGEGRRGGRRGSAGTGAAAAAAEAGAAVESIKRRRAAAPEPGYDSDGDPVLQRGEDKRILQLFAVPWLYGAHVRHKRGGEGSRLSAAARKAKAFAEGAGSGSLLGSNSAAEVAAGARSIAFTLSSGPMVRCPCCIKAREGAMRSLRHSIPEEATALEGGRIVDRALAAAGDVQAALMLRVAAAAAAAASGSGGADGSGSDALVTAIRRAWGEPEVAAVAATAVAAASATAAAAATADAAGGKDGSQRKRRRSGRAPATTAAAGATSPAAQAELADSAERAAQGAVDADDEADATSPVDEDDAEPEAAAAAASSGRQLSRSTSKPPASASAAPQSPPKAGPAARERAAAIDAAVLKRCADNLFDRTATVRWQRAVSGDAYGSAAILVCAAQEVLPLLAAGTVRKRGRKGAAAAGEAAVATRGSSAPRSAGARAASAAGPGTSSKPTISTSAAAASSGGRVAPMASAAKALDPRTAGPPGLATAWRDARTAGPPGMQPVFTSTPFGPIGGPPRRSSRARRQRRFSFEDEQAGYVHEDDDEAGGDDAEHDGADEDEDDRAGGDADDMFTGLRASSSSGGGSGRAFVDAAATGSGRTGPLGTDDSGAAAAAAGLDGSTGFPQPLLSPRRSRPDPNAPPTLAAGVAVPPAILIDDLDGDGGSAVDGDADSLNVTSASANVAAAAVGGGRADSASAARASAAGEGEVEGADDSSSAAFVAGLPASDGAAFGGAYDDDAGSGRSSVMLMLPTAASVPTLSPALLAQQGPGGLSEDGAASAVALGAAAAGSAADAMANDDVAGDDWMQLQLLSQPEHLAPKGQSAPFLGRSRSLSLSQPTGAGDAGAGSAASASQSLLLSQIGLGLTSAGQAADAGAGSSAAAAAAAAAAADAAADASVPASFARGMAAVSYALTRDDARDSCAAAADDESAGTRSSLEMLMMGVDGRPEGFPTGAVISVAGDAGSHGASDAASGSAFTGISNAGAVFNAGAGFAAPSRHFLPLAVPSSLAGSPRPATASINVHGDNAAALALLQDGLALPPAASGTDAAAAHASSPAAPEARLAPSDVASTEGGAAAAAKTTAPKDTLAAASGDNQIAPAGSSSSAAAPGSVGLEANLSAAATDSRDPQPALPFSAAAAVSNSLVGTAAASADASGSASARPTSSPLPWLEPAVGADVDSSASVAATDAFAVEEAAAADSAAKPSLPTLGSNAIAAVTAAGESTAVATALLRSPAVSRALKADADTAAAQAAASGGTGSSSTAGAVVPQPNFSNAADVSATKGSAAQPADADDNVSEGETSAVNEADNAAGSAVRMPVDETSEQEDGDQGADRSADGGAAASPGCNADEAHGSAGAAVTTVTADAAAITVTAAGTATAPSAGGRGKGKGRGEGRRGGGAAAAAAAASTAAAAEGGTAPAAKRGSKGGRARSASAASHGSAGSPAADAGSLSSGPRIMFIDVSAVIPMADALTAPDDSPLASAILTSGSAFSSSAGAGAGAGGGADGVPDSAGSPDATASGGDGSGSGPSSDGASGTSAASGSHDGAAPASAGRVRHPRAAAVAAALRAADGSSGSSGGSGSGNSGSGSAGTRGASSGGLSFTVDDALAHLLRIDFTAPHYIRALPGRGRAVFAGGFIPRGAFVAEYSGQLITGTEASGREAQYRSHGFGSYMFFFDHAGAPHCIDATAERREYGVGRLINHSRKAPNLVPRKVVVDGIPRIALLARRDITYGDELSYDYGERDKAVLAAFPWLGKA